MPQNSKKSFRLNLAQKFCRFLPPIVSQSLRLFFYPRQLAYQENRSFVTRSQTGSLFQGSTGDFHAYPFAVHGYYNWRNWAIALAVCLPGDCLIEVGGNVGTETVGFADIVGTQGQVIVVEPLPENVNSLRQLCRINDFGHVQILPVAAGSRNETVRFALPPDTHASGVGFVDLHASDEASQQHILVDCIQLDMLEITNSRKVSAVFMDVEGHEVAILQGAPKLISNYRPVIICEASPKLLQRAGASIEQLQSIIQSHGYDIFEIGRLGLHVHQVLPEPQKADWVCLPSEKKNMSTVISKMLFRCALSPCLPGFNPLTQVGK